MTDCDSRESELELDLVAAHPGTNFAKGHISPSLPSSTTTKDPELNLDLE
tara:strand:+ start:423 stop:572 length:150 start_codon:yes stop_codon:yes gene_type:complete